jgi:hypothetical protein
MSNRCEQCQKFVSLDLWSRGPLRLNGLGIDAEGDITGEVRVVLSCVECGSEMKEAHINIYVGAEDIHELVEHLEAIQENDPALEEAVKEARNKAKLEFLIPFESHIIVMDEGMLGADEQEALGEAMEAAGEAVKESWVSSCDLEVQCTDASMDEEYQRTDKHGKPIKRTRYMKKFYVLNAELEITCSGHDFSATYSVTERVQASHFEELF